MLCISVHIWLIINNYDVAIVNCVINNEYVKILNDSLLYAYGYYQLTICMHLYMFL